MSTPTQPRFRDGDHVKVIALYLVPEPGEPHLNGIVIGQLWKGGRWIYKVTHIDESEPDMWDNWYPEKDLEPMP